MSRKHIIIIIIAALDLLVLALGFILLRQDRQEQGSVDGKIIAVTQSPSPDSPQASQKPAEPSPSPGQKPQGKNNDGEEIVYEPEDTDDPVIKAKQTRIRELIQQVYALRDHYVSALQSMETSAKAEYLALPDEEKTQEDKEAIATRYINSAYSLESECDGKIDAICSEMGELLLETDGDFSIINKVRYTYASEKAAMKSEIKQTYSEFFD